MSALRIFFVGGLTSYRALFNWLSPWIMIPSFFVAPLFQILLFAYIGRAAKLESDEFYVIGNAIQYSSIPCLFAMTFVITDERRNQTLGPILTSPAPRLALFLGRALPVIVNGMVVAAVGLVAGGLLLGIDVPGSAALPLAAVVAITAFSCTGLGLVCAGLGLRVRETAVLNNVIFGLLLVFTGANVPLDELPAWMSAISNVIPLTHGIEAGRQIADGATLGDVSGLLGAEALVGVAYGVVGYALLRFFEIQAFRNATLERS